MGKHGIGKGLTALIDEARAGDSAAMIYLGLDVISVNPQQPRKKFNDESIYELAQSIRVHGLLQPLIVKETSPGQYTLIAGERRYRACRRAGISLIPVIVRAATDQQMLEVALIENLQREELNVIDEALGLKRLVDEFDFSQEEIAKRIGKSRVAISNTMRLLQLPTFVIESIQKGELTEGHGRALLQVPGEFCFKAYHEVVDGGYNVRQTEMLARKYSDHKPARFNEPSRELKPAPQQDPGIAEAEEVLRDVLKTKVAIHITNGSGRIEIQFYDEDQLNYLIGRITGHA